MTSDQPANTRINVGPGGSLDLDHLFTYHPPFGDQVKRYQLIREDGRLMAETIAGAAPASPERSTALAKVREAVFWANAAIACNERRPPNDRVDCPFTDCVWWVEAGLGPHSAAPMLHTHLLADHGIDTAVHISIEGVVHTDPPLPPNATSYDDDSAIDDLVEALRLTVEYIGLTALPPIEGWSWYDALRKHRPEVAEALARQHATRVEHAPTSDDQPGRMSCTRCDWWVDAATHSEGTAALTAHQLAEHAPTPMPDPTADWSPSDPYAGVTVDVPTPSTQQAVCMITHEPPWCDGPCRMATPELQPTDGIPTMPVLDVNAPDPVAEARRYAAEVEQWAAERAGTS